MEGQSGLGKPRRLRFKGDQPQQDTADEANGKEEGEPCQHYEHRGDLRPRRFFWTIPATDSRGENTGARAHCEVAVRLLRSSRTKLQVAGFLSA